MDHLATAIGMNPLEFRMKNLQPSYEVMSNPSKGIKVTETNPIPQMVAQLKNTSHYEERMLEIENFNRVSNIY